MVTVCEVIVLFLRCYLGLCAFMKKSSGVKAVEVCKVLMVSSCLKGSTIGVMSNVKGWVYNVPRYRAHMM